MNSLWFVVDADYRKYPYDAVDESDAMKQHEFRYGQGHPRAMNVRCARKATSSDWTEMQIELDHLECRLSDIAEEG